MRTAAVTIVWLAGLIVAAPLLWFTIYLATAWVLSLGSFLLATLPEAVRFPHLVAPAIVMLVVTAVVAAQSGAARVARGDRSSANGCWSLPIPIFLRTFCIHLFPGLLLVLVVQEIWLALPIDWKDPAEVALRVFLPGTKIGLLFALTGNFAEVASLRGSPPLHRDLVQFLLFLVPAYYAMLTAAAVVGFLLETWLAPPLEPMVSLARLFALPQVAPNRLENTILLLLLFIGSAFTAHWLRSHQVIRTEPGVAEAEP